MHYQLLNLHKKVGIDMGDGHGADTFDGDHDAAVFLDAVDGALDTFEEALGDSHLAANLLGEVLVAEEHHAVVPSHGHTLEVGHVAVGDGDNPWREVGLKRRPLSACELTRQHHIKKSPAKVLLFFENKEIVTQKFEDG